MNPLPRYSANKLSALPADTHVGSIANASGLRVAPYQGSLKEEPGTAPDNRETLHSLALRRIIKAVGAKKRRPNLATPSNQLALTLADRIENCVQTVLQVNRGGDEAKSIDEEIFRGIDRCDYSVLAYISSPDEKTGRFYEAFQSDQFKHFHAGLLDCKHIGKERIAQIKAWYGPNDPYTLSVLEGEFMDYGAGIPHIIEHVELEAWRNQTIGFLSGRRVFACDFARGGDENVLLLREGNRVSNIWTCARRTPRKQWSGLSG